MHLNFMMNCYLSCLHQCDSAGKPAIFRVMIKEYDLTELRFV
jgi:hypothetical protein